MKSLKAVIKNVIWLQNDRIHCFNKKCTFLMKMISENEKTVVNFNIE